MLHGWPGLRGRDLIALANATITGGPTPPVHYSRREFPDQDVLARHPYDEQVWLAGIGAVAELPAGVDAVVSLCRVPEAPDVTDFIEVWLIDEADPASNVNLDFVLDDTVAIVEQLRTQGRTVLLHCVQAQSRTPTVAALYGMRLRGVPAATALAAVQAVLPGAYPNSGFRAALERAGERDYYRSGRST